ncbi:MAG: ribonuclease HI [Dissulfuribacterales bacterium]
MSHETDNSNILIYADGACSGNPGPGGWGVVLKWKDHEKRLCGWTRRTTNNRMELLAVIRGLEAIKTDNIPILITTDSQYVMTGLTQWMPRWKQNGWKTTQKTAVKNSDLWQRLDALCQRFSPRWQWVKGHDGHKENEMADRLARETIQKGLAGELPEDKIGDIDSKNQSVAEGVLSKISNQPS